MSTICMGMHPSPDVWVLLDRDKTGFKMLTHRAKAWARVYHDMESPAEADQYLWVPTAIGSGILHDLGETCLGILLDPITEDKTHA